MYSLNITVSRESQRRRAGVPISKFTVCTQSSKRLTKGRVARILADALPAFRRRKGRSSALAGTSILPILEKTPLGWRAWRLCTGDNRPAGFEPPLKGRVGRLNSRGNEFSDRDSGTWESADIEIVLVASPPG